MRDLKKKKKVQSETEVRINLFWKECKRDSWGQISKRWKKYEAYKLTCCEKPTYMFNVFFKSLPSHIVIFLVNNLPSMIFLIWAPGLLSHTQLKLLLLAFTISVNGDSYPPSVLDETLRATHDSLLLSYFTFHPLANYLSFTFNIIKIYARRNTSHDRPCLWSSSDPSHHQQSTGLWR